jgi:hypothetical protein
VIEVTIYSTTKKTVQSYDRNYIPHYVREPMPVYNSDIILDKQEVEIHHLPIERFCWADGKGNYTREIFAAFDEELREIIGCSQEKFERDVQAATDRRVKPLEKELLAVKDELKTLHSLSVTASLWWAISKLWRRCNV